MNTENNNIEEIFSSSEDEGSVSDLLQPEEPITKAQSRSKGKKKSSDIPSPTELPRGVTTAELRKFAEEQFMKFKTLHALYETQASAMEHLEAQNEDLRKDKSANLKQYNSTIKVVMDGKKELVAQNKTLKETNKTLLAENKALQKEARVVLEAEFLKEKDKENKQRHDEEITRLNNEIKQLRAELKSKDTSIGKMETFTLR
jgi:predicted RNase H-like nuclease (RuvC/YqgF family)